ncbi:Dam family site-specific DNA-(adenine-N6)-methyltransferase [Candidatus Albibeggiatoa sp. nov. NOAA]|uniref:Dam family site-specific DNA-(adenine-N6)-methyltransferase n=1 Tax=Candidatus Albibeggiatoa sp. nov. NOAA TaxID=3162724 RepID=UPI0033412A26
MKVHVPPIKSQGIKTKLVPWIQNIAPKKTQALWVEPFMGTGVVAFNIAPKQALLCDTNPHLIRFYQAIANGEITPDQVRTFLNAEGSKLLEKGESHYYEIRERFNNHHQPLDFLFLNRAGFNGMIRFNRKGEFNIPFCRKPQRFAQAYITKIVNQIDYVARLLKTKSFTFKCQPFEITIAEAESDSIIYCDPPYIDRHTDYYNGWGDEQERSLHQLLSNTDSQFILSTWHHNDFRQNQYINLLWNQFNVLTREHFYHVGGSEKNRNPMIEAIITNYTVFDRVCHEPTKPQQLTLLEL